MRQLAHCPKGSLANYRAESAVQAAVRHELMGSNGELGGAEAAWDELAEGYDRLRPS